MTAQKARIRSGRSFRSSERNGHDDDAGNYRKTGLFTRAVLLLSAREIGDMEIADATERALDEFNRPVAVNGQRKFGLGSTFANAIAARALPTHRGDWARLITTPPPESALKGPLVQHVGFEQAMVAQAVSDGTDLVHRHSLDRPR